MSQKKTVLFLCTGNYYRSRFAEKVFNYLAKDNIPYKALSRGFRVSLSNPGPISIHCLQGLRDRKIPSYKPYRFPEFLSKEDLEDADIIIALKKEEHLPFVKDKFPGYEERITFWNIHDIQDDQPENVLPVLFSKVKAMVEDLNKAN